MTTATVAWQDAVPSPPRAKGADTLPALGALVRFELFAQLRGRVVPIFTAGFAVAALAIAFAGLSAGGRLAVQGFARTGISLLQLSLWVIPLVALADAALAAADGYDMELLFVQPVRRGLVVVGRALGRWAATATAILVGFGAAGIVIAASAGPGDASRFVGLVVVTLALAAAATALGTLVGVAARSRTRALAIAIGLWFVLAVGYDLAAIAALSILPRAELSWSLTALLALNPVEAARVIGTGLFGADAIAGPMGAALRRVLGPFGLVLLGGALCGWTAGPLALAARLLERRDF